MINIRFKRTGADRETEFEADLDRLPEAQAGKLSYLLEAAHFFELPELLGTAGQLDEPQYVVTVQDQHGARHTVSVNDSAVPTSLRPLLGELNSLADSATVSRK